MSSWPRTLALLLAFVACAAFAPLRRIDYVMTPQMQGAALTAMQVDVSFAGDASGETILELPDGWGGQNELWRGISDLAVISGATMSDGADAAHRVLHHRPHARIRFRYRVVQDWQGVPSAEQGNPYRPIVQPSYFHMIGDTALVRPQLDDRTPVRVRASHVPTGWTFASDLQHRGLVLSKAAASVSVGGDYRISYANDRNIRTAIRGQWQFTDAAFTARVAEIVAGHRSFWGDPSTPYLVTVTQVASPSQGWLSIGGTGLDDAFAFFATPNAELDRITRTLAHESIHTWIPAAVGGMPEEHESQDYWFSEGFTDFYTGRLLVREGIWTPAQFADDLNEMLRDYARSPVRNEPNSRVVADFWHNEDVGHLPYQRGRLLATIWDARLRAQGGSMNDVVMAMRHRAESDHALHAAELFPVVAAAYHVDVVADIARYADRGETIVLPEDTFAPCGRVTTRQAPVFHRGFDIDATQAHNNVISGVVRSGPAYAAGMRDGMVLVRREAGEIGDAEQEIAYVVRDGETQRTIRYMPRGAGTFTLQRLVIDSALAGDQLAQCTRVLTG